ncbi:MAG: PKD domain containing protein [Gammaproteobacteria bacterium]|nr:PKD domain containing protein [Gammaproteobacteria bacterium]
MRNNIFSVLVLTLPLFLIGCNDGSKSKPKDPDTGIQQTTENVAPVANAGPVQSILVGTEVKLSGSASTDANNDPLTYLWTLTSKPTNIAAMLSDVTSATPR